MNATLFTIAPLLLRTILGVIFFAHGAQKVFGWFGGHGLRGTAGYFNTAYGIPLPLGYVASFVEFLGACMLVLGFLTHIAAGGILVTMVVAIARAHTKHFFMNWGGTAGRPEGVEFSLTLGVIALAVILTGAGPWSMDALL
jgi:putative oxidoreductase